MTDCCQTLSFCLSVCVWANSFSGRAMTCVTQTIGDQCVNVEAMVHSLAILLGICGGNEQWARLLSGY